MIINAREELVSFSPFDIAIYYDGKQMVWLTSVNLVTGEASILEANTAEETGFSTKSVKLDPDKIFIKYIGK